MEPLSSANAPSSLMVTSLAAPVGVRASRIPIRSPARASHITTTGPTTATTPTTSSVTSPTNATIISEPSSSSSSSNSRVASLSSSSLRRSTLPSRVGPAVPSSSAAVAATKDNNGTLPVAAKRQPISGMNRRTLPSSTSSASSTTDATTANGTTKRLVGRNSSNGITAPSNGTTGTTSAAAIIRAKKAAAAAATPSSSVGGSTSSTRTLGTIMGGGRHVDPAQRRARKAAAAAVVAAKAPVVADGDVDGGNDDTKQTKSKVARGELYYPYGRCRYALTAGDSLGSIRAALNKHGWKELKDPNAVTWDLFWSISSRALQPAKMKPSQICNHFQANGCITTKIGLCRNARKVSGHADTFFPRCFAISEPKEMELFEKQYQIQAACAVLLRYLSLADATLHSKDPSIAAAAVPALMTPTVVWLAMLAIRGHCRKLATALAADANWSPLQPIHPRDAGVAASLASYSFTAPSDDGTISSSSSTSSGAPGATHKRRSELDRAEWKSVVKCAESFSGISKLPLVARSKADMESLAAADPNAAPLHDGMDDDNDDDDDVKDAPTSSNGTNNGDSKVASSVSSPSHADSKSSDKPKRAAPSKEPSSPIKSKDARAPSNGRATTKTTSKSTPITGEVKQRRATATSTKSRDPVWEQNIAAPLFSSRTICEALSVAAELRRVDPQFLFNGEHNVWILKPGGKSRGRGIQCFDTLLSITKYMKKDHKDKWVAQKYMERPLTVYKKKFDIRQWVFVTQFGSCLRLWFYNDCYVRFSSQDFDLTDLSPAIHLTNNSIQGKLADFDTLDFDAKGNMWSSQRFEDFLEANYSTRSIGEAKEEKSTKPAKTVWMERLRPQMKQIARYAIECGYGRMKYRSHSFELFGLDYMLDENLTPWLLEVNSSPTLCHIAVEGVVERMTYDLFCVLFAEHQRHLDEEGGRDKVGAVITPAAILERRPSLPSSTSDTNALDATVTATNDGSSTAVASSSSVGPPSSTSGVAIGSSMRGSKWELINELRLATRPTK